MNEIQGIYEAAAFSQMAVVVCSSANGRSRMQKRKWP
jgi:hypothetical protein